MPVRRVEDVDDSREEMIDEEPLEQEQEDKPPARRRRSTRAVSSEHEDEPPFVVDDEDERPVASTVVQSGWKKAKEVAQSTHQDKEWINDFRFTEEPQLVKFLSGEPMSYRLHWLEKSGKRGYVCLGEDCPLCAIGSKASPRHAFSVLNLSEDEPKVYLLQAGNRLLNQLASFDDDPKTGPLTRLFWSLSRSGSKQTTTYGVIPVKPRDLEEDWDISEEEAQEFIDAAEPADSSAIYVTPYADLKAIASAMS